MAMELHTGVVENRADPLHLGRCQVRIVGLHTDDKVLLPTEDLPWATPLQPITSAGVSGIGSSPVGPVEGTWVAIVFRDEFEQYPIMIGTFAAVPQSQAAQQAAAQKQAQQQAQDPMIQMGQQEVMIKAEEQKRKAMKDQVDAQLKAEQLAVNNNRRGKLNQSFTRH